MPTETIAVKAVQRLLVKFAAACAIACVCSMSSGEAVAQNAARGDTGSVTWLTFADCPVLLEKSVEVPALESGVLEQVDIELNATIKAGQTLARLDEELALMEVKLAQLQHQAAVELANDDSNVEFSKVALSAAREELENNSAIKTSVSGSELRRLKLAVGSAEVNLQRAELALKRAAVEAELKAATVQAANLRLKRRRIVSPIDGIVTAVHLHQGQWVEAGKPIALVADLEHLLVDCLIPIEKVDLKRIIGLEVRVESVQPSPGGALVRLAGKISSYDPQVSSQGVVRVHAKIQNARQGEHWLLLPGMNVKLEVAVPGGSPALISRQPTKQR